MAGKYTNEQGAIHALLISAPIEKESVRQFDPLPTAEVDGQRIGLKKTEAYPVIPNFGAPACVAVFGEIPEDGEGLDQSKTENMVHRDCDVGVLVRRPDLGQPDECVEAVRVTEQIGLKPKTAWVVELLVPDPTAPGSYAHSGHVKAFVPTGA